MLNLFCFPREKTDGQFWCARTGEEKEERERERKKEIKEKEKNEVKRYAFCPSYFVEFFFFSCAVFF